MNQHDFFINNVGTNATDKTLYVVHSIYPRSRTNTMFISWNTIHDPDVTPPKNEKGLTELFQEIRSTVDTEAHIVKAVFPNPSMVMQVFLQRVFAQSVSTSMSDSHCLFTGRKIQQYMEQLLHQGTAISDMAFLRILQLVHVQCSALVEDLKVYEIPSSSSRTPLEISEFQRSLSGSANIVSSTSSAVGAMLESAMEELFVPYTEGQRYLERESRSLGSLYGSLLTNFTKYHDKAQRATSSSVFDKVVSQLATAGGGSSTSAQAASALLRLGGLERAQEKPVEEEIREEEGLLSVDVAERMLRWHAEAIGRCVELTPTGDVYVFQSFMV